MFSAVAAGLESEAFRHFGLLNFGEERNGFCIDRPLYAESVIGCRRIQCDSVQLLLNLSLMDDYERLMSLGKKRCLWTEIILSPQQILSLSAVPVRTPLAGVFTARAKPLYTMTEDGDLDALRRRLTNRTPLTSLGDQRFLAITNIHTLPPFDSAAKEPAKSSPPQTALKSVVRTELIDLTELSDDSTPAKRPRDHSSGSHFRLKRLKKLA